MFLLATTPLLLLVGCGSASSANGPENGASPAPKVPVTVLTRRITWQENVPRTVVCFGRLIPVREQVLSFDRGGLVDAVEAAVGDVVGAGTVLARLEQSALEEQRRILQEDVDRVRAAIPSAPQVETRSLRQRLQQSEAQLESVQAELNRGTLVAAFDARIEEIRIAAGQGIAAGMPAIRIVEDLPPLVQVSADENVATLLTDDVTVWVGLQSTARTASVFSREALRGPVTGELVRLEFGETLPPQSWAFGDVVESRFIVSTTDTGFRVPIASLMQQDDDTWYVYVADPVVGDGRTTHQILRRDVEIVRLLEGEVIVTGELTPGDRVVISGTHRLVRNQPVTVVDETETISDLSEREPAG